MKNIPVGIIVDCTAIFAGGLLGGLLGKVIPEKLKQSLPTVFSVCAIGIGISLIPLANSLSAVFLSLIIGAVIGELLGIDAGISGLVDTVQKKASSSSSAGKATFVSLIVLFCFGTTTILGALTEGLSGDPGILLMKSILDFFTAIIFATSVGYIVSVIAVPQLIICIALFLCASFIMPCVQDFMLADFKACGGLITLTVGFRMMGLKDIKSLNLIPAFVLVMPISYLWATYVV